MQTQNLEELLESGNYRALRAEFTAMNEVDIAQFIGTLEPEQAGIAFRTLPKDVEMDVFAEMDADIQQHIISTITDEKLASIINELMVDDAVDMLEEMPAKLVKRVLRNASPATRALINQFLRYPENSAGSIMTAEFCDLKRGMTVEDAIKRIRRIGDDKETIYTCYVIDSTRHLQGVVTVKHLLLAHDTATIDSLMQAEVISVTTTADQEEAAALMAKYGFTALPVVDAEARLVGIVTVDDALDVIREEDTEDFEKMAGITPSEKAYLKTSVFTLAKNRFPWLLLLMLTSMLSGLLLQLYQPIYVVFPVLVTFITMLSGTGGNAGSQSSTMVIRGMALGEIKPANIFLVAAKEARVGLIVGTLLAIVNFVRMLVTNPGNIMLALTVSFTLIAAVFSAKLIGGTLPIAARALGLDPALMSAPIITTIVDALVLFIYFGIAKLLLF